MTDAAIDVTGGTVEPRVDDGPARDAAGLPLFEIDSRVIGARTAHQIWRMAHGALFEDNGESEDDAERFSIQVRMRQAGPLMIGAGRLSSQRYLRTPAKIAAGGIDHYFLAVCRSGGYEGVCDDQRVEARPGDCCLFSLTSPADFLAADGAHILVVMPRLTLEPLLAEPQAIGGRIVRGESAMGRILGAGLDAIFAAAERASAEEAGALARAAAQLIATCCGPRDGSPSSAERTLRGPSLLAIKRYIDENLERPDLDVDHLTDVFAMSRASLYRMVQPLGGIAAFVTRRRLGKALVELGSPELRHLQVAQIAARVGYRDRSAFNRAFFARYGVRPSELRADPAALAAALNARANADDTLFGEWLRSIG